MTAAGGSVPAWAGQGRYRLRFQWGPLVAATLAGGVCVVVDVLRFTTAVEAAVTRGVAVYPYRWRDATAAAFASSAQAGDPHARVTPAPAARRARRAGVDKLRIYPSLGGPHGHPE